ncbi:retinoic acid receptor responder protein 1 [Dromiciops gliroides]|uniref:retinoic acid receptor responder protein 1 n=1 Tax=Dromiciops gliroides TaxID=33562 RepID=UPI001CC74C7E|nr:retinoic acid receptor responder protein 1 [Dromiciops gliroides]
MLAQQQRLPGRAGPTAVLLVALLPAVAQAFSGVWRPLEPERPQTWRRLAVAPSTPKFQQAARAALHYFNYRAASPSTFRSLKQVRSGSVWVNAKKGQKFDLELTIENHKPKSNDERLGTCSAVVIFKNHKPKPTVNITCTRLLAKKEREQEDYELYKQMKQLKRPPEGIKIPGNDGYIDPSLQPMWDLAMVGSSYVMWEKTSLSLYYYTMQLTGVKQWVTSGDFINFSYTILLHEFSTQEIIPCQIHLLWYPGKPLKIRYHCQDLGTQEEVSGNGEGSAETSTEILSNF